MLCTAPLNQQFLYALHASKITSLIHVVNVPAIYAQHKFPHHFEKHLWNLHNENV